ncbi:GC-rich sequence DNA-binding factor 1-like protein [Quillaja saponaria]|uniref:GC-rich sequence DNA-binding factor 1-like protein n=1 Tax=Quillaja saponaria TaxID=32244 RepID=A0AAD7P5V3_QUISA|nr:GC-rich sequence DNA-binding factor 1-like protein [Quillaja saponaria]
MCFLYQISKEGRNEYNLRKDTSGEKDDEEEKLWEEEQFRKGLGKRTGDGSTRVGSSDAPVVQVVQQQKFIHPDARTVYGSVPSATVCPSIRRAVSASQGLDMMPISHQAEVAKKAL